MPYPLVKHRKYGSAVATNIGTFSDNPAAAEFLLNQTAPISTTDSFLGSRAEFYFDARVGTPDPPPEIWWPTATITLVAYFSTGGGGGTLNTSGTNEHYLGSQLLVPTVTLSVTAPGEYIVQWKQTEPLHTTTSRKGTGASGGPSVNWYAVAYDPYNAFDGTYASISFDWYLRAFSLWGAAS